jgi:hypothetical protein
MKKIKTFERFSKRDNRLLIKKPDVGDLVVGFITGANFNLNDLKGFLNNTVGEIEDVKYAYYTLKYNTIPDKLENNFIEYNNSYHIDILHDNIRMATPQEKKEFLLKNAINKYNL